MLEENACVKKLRGLEETCWYNPKRKSTAEALAECPLGRADVLDAEARLQRFAPLIRTLFPETQPQDGLIESPVREIPEMKRRLEKRHGIRIPGRLWLKMDSHLPISGSVKARGGIYEVLKTAEDIAAGEGILRPGDDYRCFDTPAFRKVLSQYTIAVGSTGNLGLSIGIMSAKLGFRAVVHMSADARQWKKDLLRARGVQVIEYAGDYSEAVAQGRRLAEQDEKCHFVDDENSRTLFLGYAVAALRLKRQLDARGVAVDASHPLKVYLPCGVGGGPGGIAFGLKLMYGDDVHCYFAEPTHACCMLLGLCTGLHNEISVQDIGIAPETAADGLAVGRASGFVGRLIEPFLTGCYTLKDDRLFEMLAQLADGEGVFLEPSALAGMYGPVLMRTAEAFRRDGAVPNATHLVWATGGQMVPEAEMNGYYRRGRKLLMR